MNSILKRVSNGRMFDVENNGWRFCLRGATEIRSKFEHWIMEGEERIEKRMDLVV